MKQITPFHTKAQITKLKIAPKIDSNENYRD